MEIGMDSNPRVEVRTGIVHYCLLSKLYARKKNGKEQKWWLLLAYSKQNT
jgi:hypothetical protein